VNTLALIIIATFAATLLVVLVPYYLFVVKPDETERRKLRRRLRSIHEPISTKRDTHKKGILKDIERLSAIGPLNALLVEGGPLAAHLRDVIRLAGVSTIPGQVVLGSLCLALVTHVVVVAWLGIVWIGAIAGTVMLAAPYVVLRVIATNRMRKFEEHFPEAIDLIARTLRAGHSFATGLRLTAEEIPDPVAGEFRLLHDQQNYGLSLDDGLRNLAKRMPIVDVRFFVTAILTQRETGGNLAEVLDNLSAVIRERFRIKRQLRVLSARGRLTGVILAALPPGLAVMMIMRVPEHFRVLYEDPQGVRMVIVAITLQIIGAFMIKKITTVEY